MRFKCTTRIFIIDTITSLEGFAGLLAYCEKRPDVTLVSHLMHIRHACAVSSVEEDETYILQPADIAVNCIEIGLRSHQHAVRKTSDERQDAGRSGRIRLRAGLVRFIA